MTNHSVILANELQEGHCQFRECLMQLSYFNPTYLLFDFLPGDKIQTFLNSAFLSKWHMNHI